MLTVKILGSDCPSYQRLARETCMALEEAQIAFKLIEITDFAEIANHGVMRTPALIINGDLLSSGMIPTQDQIIAWAQERIIKA